MVGGWGELYPIFLEFFNFAKPLRHTVWEMNLPFFATGWTKEEFSWTEYLAQTGSAAASDDAFRKVRLPLLLSICQYHIFICLFVNLFNADFPSVSRARNVWYQW